MVSPSTRQKKPRRLTPTEAQTRLLEISMGFCASQAFFTACNLGVFRALSDAPATSEELSRKIGIHPEASRRFLMALRELGLVESKDSLFRNSELGEFCSTKAAVDLEPLSMWGSPFYHMWEYLPDALREYSPRWQQAVGTTAEETFAAMYEDTARLRRFAACMNAYSVPDGQEIAEQFDFTPFRCVLDVGGGPAGFVVQIGLRYRKLRAIIMDLAPMCKAVTEEWIRANDLTGRFTAVPADLFAGPYPSGADLIMLNRVLHDWGDESCRRILRNCFAAIPSGAPILIGEKLLNEDFSGTQINLLEDLHMLVACEPGARHRSEAEFHSLLTEVGFKPAETIWLDGSRDLIVARKP